MKRAISVAMGERGKHAVEFYTDILDNKGIMMKS